MMDPFILNLGIRWLPAVDAFSASCVSQEWRRFLSADRDNGDLWKQICRNSGPSDVPKLESSADYQRLAMGLRLRDSKEPPASPQEQSYTPTTRPEDYFAIVDLYKRHEEANGKRRKEVITSLVCPVNGAGFGKSCGDEMLESGPILHGVNPYSANMKDSNQVREWRQQVSANNRNWVSTPLAYTANAASRELEASPRHRVDVTLFRRDNAKSVCLLHGAPLDDVQCDDDHIIARTDFADLTLAGNDTGMIARGLIDEQSTICVECLMSFAPKVPPYCSSDEKPPWLTNCRQPYQDRRVYEPNASDMTALSKIGQFEFGLEYFGIQFYKDSEWDTNPLKNQNELIIALEGLCWE